MLLLIIPSTKVAYSMSRCLSSAIFSISMFSPYCYGESFDKLRIPQEGIPSDVEGQAPAASQRDASNHYPNLPVRYSSVLLSCGTVNILAVEPNSIKSPRYKNAVKSDTRAAWAVLCVTTIMV